MTDAEILKIISHVRGELNAIEKYIKERQPAITPPSDADRGLKESAAQVIELLNNVLDAGFSTKADKNVKPISARLREGYTLEDFRLVVEYKKAEWSGNDKMRGYLRPETLFGPKFDGYLNAARAKVKSKTAKSYDVIDIEAKLLGRLMA